MGANNMNKLTVGLFGEDRTLSRTLRKGGKEADTLTKKLERANKKLASFGTEMTTKVTLPVIAGLTLATKAAMEEGQQMALLEKITKKNTGATDKQVDAVERWVTAMEKQSTYADDQLRPAFQALVAVTKDIGDAQGLTTVAMDVAAAKGIDLTTVSEAIAKAYNGNVGALGRLGIATKDSEGKTLSFEQVIKNATATFGGSYDAALDTSAGKMQNLKNRFANITESIGNAVIPMFETLVPYIERAAEWFENLTDGERKFLVKAALIAAAAGPAAKMASMLFNVGSGGVKAWKAVATLARKVGILTTAAQTANAENAVGGLPTRLGKTATNAGKATTKVGGFARGLLRLAGPIAAIAAASWGLDKAVDAIRREGGWDQFKNFWTGKDDPNKQRFDAVIAQIEAIKASGGKVKIGANTNDFNAKSRLVRKALRAIDQSTPKPTVMIQGRNGRSVAEEANDARKKLMDALKASIGVPVKITYSFSGGTGDGPGIPSMGGPGYSWAYGLAKQFGLGVTSTFRPGAVTADGNRSHHSIFGKAADFAGPTRNMGALANFLFPRRDFDQVIYQHRMSRRGAMGYFPRTDHFNHVHAARAYGDGPGIGAPTPIVTNVVRGLTVVFSGCQFGYDPAEVGYAIDEAAARNGFALARG